MSNVRPRANQMRSMLVHAVEIHRSVAVRGSSLHRFVKRQLRCIGAGRPSVGGRRTVLSCQGFLQHRLGLSVLQRPAHQRFGSDERTGQTRVCSAAVSSSGRSMKHSLSFNSLSCAATYRASMNTNTSLASQRWGAGPLVAEAAQRIKIRARSVLSHARPNPSIEGTCNIWLRQLSPAPHVKR